MQQGVDAKRVLGTGKTASRRPVHSPPAWRIDMSNASRVLLARLGAGELIAQLCTSQNWSRDDFDAWWRAECQARVPATAGAVPLPVSARVQIARDEQGIPHITAANDHDLFFGFGFATA
ncbi:MAG TPA: hypothetical protein DDY91_04245, partial [Planctomycetaceae bacterium]|nr:hypothetical protein [Planctomycetaceae bacterium]